MKKLLTITASLLVFAVSVNAANITPFSGVTSAKLVATINAVMYGTNPSCYPGSITTTIGFIDYQSGIDMMVDPLAENAIWQTVVGTLAPGALTFDFETATTMDGADVSVTVPGDPYEKDITTLFQQVVADGNSSGKAYAICFIASAGPGKINLNSSEGSTPYDQLIGIEVVDASGTHLFKFKKTGGDPANNHHDRIQYTGHRAAHNQNYNDAFAMGGHEGHAPSGYTSAEDRCAFFFHRGLAANLGWTDPDQSDVIAVEAPKTGASLKLSLNNMPNPFTGTTRIAYTLEKNLPVQLSVYDVAGKLVRNLSSGIQTAGQHSVSFDAKNLPMGMYVLRLKAGDRVMNRSMIVMK